uniref:SFRICE_025761 n=1 Tax=Spodoptera frugiperda TaxID=7108 RepID=A0A2H1WH40_SPOFR
MTSRISHKSGVREARSVIKVAAVLTVYLTGGRSPCLVRDDLENLPQKRCQRGADCCSADCIPHGWPVVIVDYLNSFLMVDSMQLKTKAVSGRRGVLLKLLQC